MRRRQVVAQRRGVVGQREAGRGLRVRLHAGRRREHLAQLLGARAAARATGLLAGLVRVGRRRHLQLETDER